MEKTKQNSILITLNRPIRYRKIMNSNKYIARMLESSLHNGKVDIHNDNKPTLHVKLYTTCASTVHYYYICKPSDYLKYLVKLIFLRC